MKNVLFLCSANKWRSPTAEQIFTGWPGAEVDSAGLNAGAVVELSTEQLEWASIIFVMEKTHRAKLSRKFKRHLKGKRIICLDIPDHYEFMDETLIAILKAKVTPHLR